MDSKNILKVTEQLPLFITTEKKDGKKSYLDKLTFLLKSDLNFHKNSDSNLAHNFHSFPAKFPPQLPKLFIDGLTIQNDIVLDPMTGSGTTILEAYSAHRKAIGFDIDPLALKISKVKTTPISKKDLLRLGQEIYSKAKSNFWKRSDDLKEELKIHFDLKTKDFLNYWFLPEIQLELFALWKEIDKIDEESFRNFFDIVFSSIIITKSGGVSLALDLGHTRPHKTKVLLDRDGSILFGKEYFNSSKNYNLTKTVKSPIEEFWKKLLINLNCLIEKNPLRIKPEIKYCDAQQLCLPDQSIDLIVTSPPYASNAIDYMRAHKFSLVWFGYNIDHLSTKRKEYIGTESAMNYSFEKLPLFTTQKINEISQVNENRGKVLKKYFSEMKKTLREMYRVLKPRKAGIVVVGSSVMRGNDTETQKCITEIGKSIGFIVPHIGSRKLDRNRRMMPAGLQTDLSSQIQQRMHEEYIIGFYKP